jgi:WD40 repeat protein
MGSLRRFAERHAGVALALLMGSLLAGLLAWGERRSGVTLPVHEGHVVEFSPDGRLVLTDGASGGCLRDRASGRVRTRLMRAGAGGSKPATDITWPRFTPDGRHLVAQLGRPGFGAERVVTLAIFDVATGREVAAFEGVGSEGHGWYLCPAEYALSADGSTLAFCRFTGVGSERTGTVTVWDVEAGKVVAEFLGLPPLALAPDGGAVAHGENDDARSRTAFPAVRVLKSERQARTRPPGPGASVGQNSGPVAFSADGGLLAARTLNGRAEVVEVRDVRSGQLRAALKPDISGHDRFLGPQLIRFSPDARTLFLQDPAGHLRTRSGVIQCWDISGPSPRLGPQGPSESFAPAASRAAISQLDVASLRDFPAPQDAEVAVLDLPAAEARIRLAGNGIVLEATISPDGQTLALPSSRNNQPDRTGIGAYIRHLLRAVGILSRKPPVSNVITLREAATGRLIGTIERAIAGPPGPITFSPDGRTLVVKEFPWDSAAVNSDSPIGDWHVELWAVPAGWWSGRLPWLAAATAVGLVLAGAWFDRWRARRRRSAVES